MDESRYPKRVYQTQFGETDFTFFEVGAFAGASISGSFTGALEWLNPEGSKKGLADFKAFFEVFPTIDGQAGAGAMASF